MTIVNALGEFLRARREQVSPKDVGIAAGGFRRVRGLRREEVATLAGISADYYLRLEQGRDRNPSTQVLDALARVLQLDEAASAHLTRLGGHLPLKAAVGILRASVGPDLSHPRIQDLVAELSTNNRFRTLWCRHDVLPKRGRTTHLRHPKVGDLSLTSNKLLISGTPGLMVVVYHAVPGSPDAAKLNALLS